MKERKDAKWRKWAAAWREADTVREAAKVKLLELAGEESCFGAGVKHVRSLCNGNLQYDQIPQLKGVDLAKYRKPSYFKSQISAVSRTIT